MAEKNFDNKKYTKEISAEQLAKFSESEYQTAETKMDQILLSNVSEQRCRIFFCSYSNCIANKQDSSRCLRLFRQLISCAEKERKKCVFEFMETGAQPRY